METSKSSGGRKRVDPSQEKKLIKKKFKGTRVLVSSASNCGFSSYLYTLYKELAHKAHTDSACEFERENRVNQSMRQLTP